MHVFEFARTFYLPIVIGFYSIAITKNMFRLVRLGRDLSALGVIDRFLFIFSVSRRLKQKRYFDNRYIPCDGCVRHD